MKIAVVRLQVVFYGIVLVGWTPTVPGKETPQTIFRAENSKWMTEICLDKSRSGIFPMGQHG